MSNFIYVMKRSMINNIKKYIKKPSFYAILLGVGFYLYGVGGSIIEFLSGNTRIVNTLILFLFMLFIIFTFHTGGLHGIAKQRAVLFKTADVHFAFSAPINPKIILLYAYSRNIISELVIYLIVMILGSVVMHLPFTMLILTFLGCILLTLLEVSLVIIVYGKQDGEGKIAKYLSWFVRAVLLFFVVYLLYMFFVENAGMNITKIIDNPVIYLFPFIGWSISVFYAITIEATLLSIIGSILFIATAIILSIYAFTLQTEGEFYEEAVSFADEYAQIRKRAKKGEIHIRWKKRKLKSASVTYKGTGAKAILYRQLLEYKKQRFFIFGFRSLVNIIISCMIAYFGMQFIDDLPSIPFSLSIVLIGIMAYISILTSGTATKWSKEMDIIYTFMIPDSAFKKLWYSTIMDHIRATIDGLLFVIPASIGLRLSIVEIIGCIGIYIVLETGKLYLQIISQTVLRAMVGKTFSGLIQTLIQFAFLYGGWKMMELTSLKYTSDTLLLVLVGYGLIVSMIGCFIASTQFERMEASE